jgi:hypothetical protein
MKEAIEKWNRAGVLKAVDIVRNAPPSSPVDYSLNVGLNDT